MSENQIEKVLKVYDNFSDYVNGKIERGIEENRKGPFSLAFIDEQGKPLENVKVSVKQISHEFNFGCNLFYLNHCATQELNEEYKTKFKKIFNYGVVPLYWDTLEPTPGQPRFDLNSEKIHRRPAVDEAVNFCKENDIRMKGHCLVYNSFQPAWRSDDGRELKIQIEKRLKAIGERYSEDFHDVDVINEMYRIYKSCYKGNGCRDMDITDEPDHEKWAFEISKKHFPYSRLFWNEGMYESLGETQYSGFRGYYYMTLKDHINRGVPIEGIGIQYHANCEKATAFQQLRHVCNPLRLIDAMERYGDFNLPIHISEISIPSFGYDAHDEELQAKLTKRLFKLWFSCKHVNSIVWWNLSDKSAFGEENKYHSGLLREDLSEKPAYKVVDQLINQEWNTSFNTIVNGRLNFSGFYGDYLIEAECDGKKVSQKLRLCHDTTGYDNRLCDFRVKKLVLR